MDYEALSLRKVGAETAEDCVKLLLHHLGQDINREGLRDTPERWLHAMREMTQGYHMNTKTILSTVFDQEYDEVIISRNIPFTSLCEHHLLPFTGTADVGYIPGFEVVGIYSGTGMLLSDAKRYKVVGLSKLARLVDCFALRLQIQEQMTQQIAQALVEHLNPNGVAVVVRAEHACMSCRGVRKSGSEMITSCMLGAFREDASARQEFLQLCGGGG